MKHSLISADRHRLLLVIVHMMVIGMVFVLPELLWSYTRTQPAEIRVGVYLKTAIYVAVFYLNYCYVVPRTLQDRRSVWRFVLYNILVMAAALALNYLYWRLVHSHGVHVPRRMHPMGMKHQEGLHEARYMLRYASMLLRDVAMLVLTIGLSVALRMSVQWVRLKERHQAMLAEQREAELQSLKSQLNPHFLFNTLNSIYALIAINPDTAQGAVHRLSRMLRYVLYENTSVATVEAETGFVSDYVDLMTMRMGPGRVDMTIDLGDTAGCRIAPMLFVTLIENAFKHGNTGNPDDVISIAITSPRPGVIQCRTSNAFLPRGSGECSGGIGIANLRRRLHLIYGNRARLTTSIDGNRYTSSLTIQLDNDQ